MEDLTNFENTDDVLDAAIEAVRQMIPRMVGDDDYNADHIREDCRKVYSVCDRAIIIAARLIQRHHPEYLIDEDVRTVREVLVKVYEDAGWLPTAGHISAGTYDKQPEFLACLECLRIGRQGND